METKKQIRNNILGCRNAMLDKERQVQSVRLCNQIISEIENSTFSVVHSFISMGTEVDILPVIRHLFDAQKTVIAPKTLPNRILENRVLDSLNNLEPGVFGTQHPANQEIYRGKIDLFLIPGVGFDSNFNRLGYGGGYYDKLLSENPNAKKWAVCFPIQFIDEVPVEPHDIKMDRIFY
ncbi:MAG: 5-formyltetrahydrofolate cyclo-ligase [Salibacteraceae bacterium]